MSHWSYVQGTVEISAIGRTQLEMEYILKTVLQHLPAVSGSEGDMAVHICMRAGSNGFSSCDEFGRNDNPITYDQNGNRTTLDWRTQDSYILMVEGQLRDTTGEGTYRQFIKWLCRLASRIPVVDVLVRIWDDCTGQRWTIDEPRYHCRLTFTMYPAEGEPVWTDYLMWENEKDSWYPEKLDTKFRSGYERGQ